MDELCGEPHGDYYLQFWKLVQMRVCDPAGMDLGRVESEGRDEAESCSPPTILERSEYLDGVDFTLAPIGLQARRDLR